MVASNRLNKCIFRYDFGEKVELDRVEYALLFAVTAVETIDPDMCRETAFRYHIARDIRAMAFEVINPRGDRVRAVFNNLLPLIIGKNFRTMQILT